MLGTGDSRGANLEILLTKLLYLAKGLSLFFFYLFLCLSLSFFVCLVLLDDIRIVGMSATLSNVHDLCRFIDAELYTNQFRPVELIEYVKLDKSLYKMDKSKLLQPSSSSSSCQDKKLPLCEKMQLSRLLNYPVIS